MQLRRIGLVAALAAVPGTVAAQSYDRLSQGVRSRVSVPEPVVVPAHVRLINGTGAPAVEDQTVVVENGRITAVGPAAAAGSADVLGLPHPRAYGTFPRVIAHYVKQRGVLSLPEAIRKMTSWPATRMRLADRGVIREGMWADVVIFDLERLDDRATYDQPTLSPKRHRLRAGQREDRDRPGTAHGREGGARAVRAGVSSALKGASSSRGAAAPQSHHARRVSGASGWSGALYAPDGPLAAPSPTNGQLGALCTPNSPQPPHGQEWSIRRMRNSTPPRSVAAALAHSPAPRIGRSGRTEATVYRR